MRVSGARRMSRPYSIHRVGIDIDTDNAPNNSGGEATGRVLVQQRLGHDVQG